MKNEVFYCLVLSESQARFLATSKYGIDRMKALVSLIGQASTSYHEYKKKGFETYVQIGQVVISEVELSRLWGCDRKTVSRVLDTMNELELVSTEQNNRTSIHTLLCVSAWYIDGQKILNPFYVPMKERFPENNPPANDNAVNVAGSADSTVNPTQTEQILATVSEENVRSRLQFLHSLYPTTALQYIIMYRMPRMMVVTLPAMSLQEFINQMKKKK